MKNSSQKIDLCKQIRQKARKLTINSNYSNFQIKYLQCLQPFMIGLADFTDDTIDVDSIIAACTNQRLFGQECTPIITNDYELDYPNQDVNKYHIRFPLYIGTSKIDFNLHNVARTQDGYFVVPTSETYLFLLEHCLDLIQEAFSYMKDCDTFSNFQSQLNNCPQINTDEIPDIFRKVNLASINFSLTTYNNSAISLISYFTDIKMACSNKDEITDITNDDANFFIEASDFLISIYLCYCKKTTNEKIEEIINDLQYRYAPIINNPIFSDILDNVIEKIILLMNSHN